MSDDQGNTFNAEIRDEQALEARLTRLAPFMRRQDMAQRELDPAFASSLRVRLLALEEPQPDPVFARRLRARLVGSSRAVPIPAPRSVAYGPRRIVSAVMLVVAAAIVALVGRPQSHHATTFADLVPIPSVRDLTFNYPAVSILHQVVDPTQSLVHPVAGIAYRGRLTFRFGRLPVAPHVARAYRLGPPTPSRPFRQILGIQGALRRVRVEGTTWIVAADGGKPRQGPLHSIAVSLSTGEVIYHDERNGLLRQFHHPLNRNKSIAAARLWLTRLGWRTSGMPVETVRSAPGKPDVQQVELGWVRQNVSLTNAATLWVSPNGSVIEAWVWPSIQQVGSVPTRTVRSASEAVRRGLAPVAIQGVDPTGRASGIAIVRGSAIVTILSHARDGHVYLVPVYRFQGKVRFPARAGTHAWYALVPAMAR